MYLDLFFLLFSVYLKIATFSTEEDPFFFFKRLATKRMPDRSTEFKLMNLSPAYRKGSGHVQNYKTFQAIL